LKFESATKTIQLPGADAGYVPEATAVVATPTERKGPVTFHGVQAVRGLAASMVVLYHASQFWSKGVSPVDGALVWMNGWAGVDIFFIISGFVMAVSALGKATGPEAAGKFLERRVVRVMPLYWLVTTVLLLRELFGPAATFGPAARPSAAYVVCSYLLVPVRNSFGSIAPLLAPGWTLSFEMFFYLCFAGALALRWNVVKSLTLGLGMLTVLGFFRLETWPPVTVLLDPLLLEFVLGLWLGRAVLLGWRVKPGIAVGLGVAALVGILTAPVPAGVLVQRAEWAGMAFAIVLAAVMLEARLGRWVPRWVLLVGDASYSLYLWHFLLLNPCMKVMARVLHLQQGVLRLRDELCCMAFILAVSLTFAVLMYLVVERPMNERLRGWLHLRRHGR
jgi:peptidoglycan/LPS O-acetylase OafA/YrhL